MVQAIKLLDPAARTENRSFAGGLVVIGQSFELARDRHATPLGAMPGGMVLINSVDSMLDVKLLHEPSVLIKFVIELGSIIGIGYAFAYFDSFIATLVILLSFVPLLLWLNYVFLRWSIWLDFSLPLLGIFAHRMFSEVEEHIKTRGEGARH